MDFLALKNNVYLGLKDEWSEEWAFRIRANVLILVYKSEGDEVNQKTEIIRDLIDLLF